MKRLVILIVVLLASLVSVNATNHTIVNASQDLIVYIPEFINTFVIDISGTTTPGAKLDLFINNKRTRFINSTSTGSFIFNRVSFNSTKNEVKIISQGVGIPQVTKRFDVNIDIEPPIIDINIPEVVKESKYKVNSKTDEPVNITIITSQDNSTNTKSILVNNAGTFSFDLDLIPDVVNNVELKAVDRAGNEFSYNAQVTPDTKDPVLETKLEELNPSFSRSITINGKVSEKATVEIILNDKSIALKNTDDDGTFSIPITLETRTNISVEPQQVSLEANIAYPNQIKIIARDRAGRTATIGPSTIEYKLCGTGGPFTIITGDPLPDKLNPRLLLNGVQMFGFPFNIEYKGGYNVTVNRVEIKKLDISPKEKKKFDNDLVKVVNPLIPKSKKATGYADVKFSAFDPLKNDKDATTFDREKNISQHRLGDCLVPGFGCMRFFLEIDIAYTESRPAPIFADPNRATTSSSVDVEQRHQRTCVKSEVMIDMTRPEHLLPKKQLQSTINFLDSTINAIDSILKPITTIGTYLFYGCAGGTLGMYVLVAKEKWDCDFSSGLSTFDINGGKWDKRIAQAGLCDEVYAGQDKKKSACSSCENSIRRNRNYETNILRPICDRVACPSAPTLQTYMRNNWGRVDEISALVNRESKNNPSITNIYQKWGILTGGDKRLFVGNDCAYKEFSNNAIFGLKERGYENVRKIFKLYRGTLAEGNVKPEDCNDLVRPAHPNCCGTNYMKEWGTACGVSNLGIDTFDEIKESTCLAANLEGRNDVDGEQCNRLWNSIAGFCEPEGGAVPEVVNTGVRYANQQKAAVENEVRIFVIPRTLEQRPELVTGFETATATKYDIYIGYISSKYEFEELDKQGQKTKTKSISQDQDYLDSLYLNAKASATTRKPINEIFYDQTKGTLKDYKDVERPLKEAICDEAKGSCDPDIENIYNSVRNVVGTTNQEYIVVPDSGLLRGVQCACFPAVIGWLNRWKQVATITKNCLQTIMVTGTGSAGPCEQFMSQYVCDFLFESISCFSQKFSTPGPGKRIQFGGIGNIVGTLTSAGTETQNRIRSRYGDTATFKTMFEERKLVHSMCAAAFGLPWKPDLANIFKETVEQAPIPTQGLIKPCRRRFAGFIPTTNPPGLTTWVYEFGLIMLPGSKVNFDIELQCSNGFRCNPSDGFVLGRCDCADQPQPIKMKIAPNEIKSYSLEKDQILESSVFYPITAGSGESRYRYDKARIKWYSIDTKQTTPATQSGEAECDIDLVGGSDAPNYCTFDVTTFSYRCDLGQSSGKIDVKSAATKVSDVYKIDDNLEFDVILKQSYPFDPSKQLESKKFLVYEIKNEDNKRIDQLSISPTRSTLLVNSYELAQDGEYTKTIPGPGDRQLTIKKDFFSNGTSAPEKLQSWTKKRGNIRTMPLINSFASSKNQTQYIFHFYTKGTDKNMTIYETNVLDVTSTSLNKLTELQLPSARFNGNISGQQIAFDLDLLRIRGLLSDTDEELKILLITNPDIYAKPGTCINNATVDWTAVFTAYDADKEGMPSNQVALTPSSQEASLTIPFKVKCQ